MRPTLHGVGVTDQEPVHASRRQPARRLMAARRQPAFAQVIGLATAIAAALAPAELLAAHETVVDTQRNATVVFIVITLLLGAVVAGLFFASPLRRWITSSPIDADSSTKPVIDGEDTFVAAPITTQEGPAPGSTPSAVEPPRRSVDDARSTLSAASRRPQTPRSSAAPEADGNWKPDKR